MTENELVQHYKYTVKSVTPTTAPTDEDGSWYTHVLERDNRDMVCKARGTLLEVTEHAEKIVFDLNSRRANKTGAYSQNRNSTNKK